MSFYDRRIQVDELDQHYLPGPRPMSFHYWGRALSP